MSVEPSDDKCLPASPSPARLVSQNVEGYMGNYGPTMDRQAGCSRATECHKSAPLLCRAHQQPDDRPLPPAPNRRRIYKQAALVVWPRSRRFQILAACNVSAAVRAGAGWGRGAAAGGDAGRRRLQNAAVCRRSPAFSAQPAKISHNLPPNLHATALPTL